MIHRPASSVPGKAAQWISGPRTLFTHDCDPGSDDIVPFFFSAGPPVDVTRACSSPAHRLPIAITGTGDPPLPLSSSLLSHRCLIVRATSLSAVFISILRWPTRLASCPSPPLCFDVASAGPPSSGGPVTAPQAAISISPLVQHLRAHVSWPILYRRPLLGTRPPRLSHHDPSYDISHAPRRHLVQDDHLAASHQPAESRFLQRCRQGPIILQLLPFRLRPPRLHLASALPRATSAPTRPSDA